MEPIDDEGSALHAMTSGMQHGTNEAWQLFHETQGPALFRCLLAATYGDAHLAAEALQHAYLRIARHVRPCAEPAMFRVWTRRVARSALSDIRRREGRFASFLNRWQCELPEGDDTVPDDHLWRSLETGLDRLPESDRSLLEAKYLRGETVAAISARLGLTPKAIESRLTRARDALRGLIDAALHSYADPEK